MRSYPAVETIHKDHIYHLLFATLRGGMRCLGEERAKLQRLWLELLKAQMCLALEYFSWRMVDFVRSAAY